MLKVYKQGTELYKESVAIICCFLGIFLLLSLVSYVWPIFTPQPTLPTAGGNWCGDVGFYTAFYLFSFVGVISFFPVLLLFYVVAAVFTVSTTLDRLPMILAGGTGTLLAASGLLAGAEQIFFPPEFILPGGYLGDLLRNGLEGALGVVGSVLILVLVLIFSLMASIRFSPLASVLWFLEQTPLVIEKIYVGKEWTEEKIITWKTERQKRLKERPASLTINRPVAALPVLQSAKKVFSAVEKKLETSRGSLPAVHQPVKREKGMETENNRVSVKSPTVKAGKFQLPPVSLLEKNTQGDLEVDRQHYYNVSEKLVAKLLDFSVKGEVVGVSPGPVVTTYEFAPAAGVKINKVVSLADDVAMVLKVDRVRVVGSIPGKAAIGIEIPNPERKIVFFRDILLSNAYRRSASFLTVALGVDSIGKPAVADLVKMPHLLIAGATGAGKSVAINAFICSILYKATPDMVRLLMIDPKRIELSVYEGIPHLLHPVVVEPKMASRALIWAVREMERRYKLLEALRVKSFTSYNEVAEEKLPYIVIIVDELADLMMVASKDVETSIARLAQMARAAGMHIILATQRPSVDVLTGLIKANFPTRISFKVSSKVDSRTILDGSGAEHLLGNGDMLFLPPGAAKLKRIHGAFISEEETERIIAFLKQQGAAEYDETVLQMVEEDAAGGNDGEKEYDEKYDEAVAVVTETGQASISMVQRRLRVGYNRAARMIEMMERDGVVGPSDGSRPREVLAQGNYS
ncbi:DNA segregation ATPase FtsK/SpoIIIE, S-DNA-T family [Candidatus Electrothrix aarhusensis]|uniref:DNA segregation ATPase FtsK/SpoIIIE, S-DNA-T family n=1 Tax=Candidatus Electrothrix aarhusensis TaxID=1859131 RepID=A0A3S4TBE5_9BACT|nr:DNA segregation ATPase FtsK/SpoIIIE, S-DNA-T family [Candidatus Electrothrix aarhusensis]